MVHIIIKNGTKHFTPHYNRSTGRYYGTSREYYSDLKSKGLEPFDESSVKKRKPSEYKPSQWAKDIVRHVESTGVVSGNIKNELRKAQIKEVPKELRDKVNKKSTGGWY